MRSHTIRSACDILHTHVLDPGLTGEAVEACRFFLRNMLRCAFSQSAAVAIAHALQVPLPVRVLRVPCGPETQGAR